MNSDDKTISQQEAHERLVRYLAERRAGKVTIRDVDQFTPFVNKLLASETFCKEVEDKVKIAKASPNGSYEELNELLEAHNIYASAEALEAFGATEFTWHWIRHVGAMFGDKNVATFN